MAIDKSTILIDRTRDKLIDAFGMDTLQARYMVGDETSPQEAFARASAAFATDADHAQRLYDYASNHWFMFATPLLSNGGTDRGLPISCFLNNVPDSRGGILDHYTENGWLASMGGGIGTYWGNLRSNGTETSKGSKTSGVVAFTAVVDRQMLAFSQGVTRRGSAAVYLPVDHPEIEEWLIMRRETGGDANRKATNLHHGICISDSFMNAVERGLDYPLIDPHTKKVTKRLYARTIWRSILEIRMETGEPYLFFTDTANKGLPQPLKDIGLTIPASNLCTEIMLPTGIDPRDGLMRTAVCCLSSVNLLKWSEWRHNTWFIPDLMEMLDNCLSYYIATAPASHAAAVRSAERERSVGLGAMGWHSLLQSLRIGIESMEARALNAMIFEHLQEETNTASLNLGTQRGEAPDMRGTGHRFAHRMAVAPNASSGIICGNTSPSIEPRKNNAFLHKTLGGSFTVKNTFLEEVLVEHGKNNAATWKSILANKGSVQHLDFLTDQEKSVFKTAIEIDQMALVQLAADRQVFIDQGQSVNLFFDKEAPARVLHAVHFAAWKLGLKALYYCRSVALKRANLVNLSTERAAMQPKKTEPKEAEECLACQG